MNADASSEIDRVVAAAVAGDRRAAADLLKIIRPLVVRYCRPRIGSDRAGATADDVAQEVCLAVLRALPSYQDQGRPFLAFVYGVAAHKVVEAHRSAGRDRSTPTDSVPEEQDLHVGPEQAAVALSGSAGMRELLDRLPPKQREILVMRVVVGLSAEETAAAVGSTAGAVRVAQKRAVSKLRAMLGGYDDSTELPARESRDTPNETSKRATREQMWFSSEAKQSSDLVNEVLDNDRSGIGELAESLTSGDPKEHRAHQALVEDIRSRLDMADGIAEVTEHYRARQLRKDVRQSSAYRVEEGIAAVLEARRRRRSSPS